MISRKLLNLFSISLVRPLLCPSFPRTRCRFPLQLVRCVHQLNGDEMSSISVSDIKKTLKINFGGFLEGHTCLVIDCPLCKKRTSGGLGHGKLYINSKTGYSLCTQCLSEGSWQNVEAYISALQTTTVKKPQGIQRGSTVGSCLPKAHTGEEYRAAINSYMERGISVDQVDQEQLSSLLDELNILTVNTKTLHKYGALVDTERKFLILPVRLASSGPIVGLKILSPKQRVKTAYLEDDTTVSNLSHGPDELNIPSDTQWMFGLQHVKSKEEVIITSSAADVLTVAQHLNIPAVCSPMGIGKLPQSALPFLEHVRKVILWLDNGIQGWEAARIFAKKLGERRCYFIRPSLDNPSPCCAASQNLSLSTIVKSSLPMSHKSITTFSSLRDEVFAELTQSSTVAGTRWKRFPVLTELLKGHRRGELTVFTGPTGAGKTTFISEYSLDLCMQKVSTLWGSFEIRNVRLAKMMLQQFAGFSLEQNINAFPAVADDFEKLPLYFLLFHGQQNLKTVLEAMSHAVYVHDIAHVIVDNLQFMMGTGNTDSTPMDRFWKQDQIIGAFRQFATLNNVHVTLVIHPRKEETEELSTSSIFGSAKASQEADNVLILQDKRLTDPASRKKYIQVTKNRYSGDLGVMPLEFHKESLSFALKKRSRPPKRSAAPSSDD